MDPQLHQPPSMDLPAPHLGEGPTPQEGLAKGVDTTEAQLTQTAEQPGAAMPANPLAAPVTGALPPPVPADPALTVPASQSPLDPAIADDGDLIEKEWVLKAKHIVEKTKHDPHEQTKAVNRVKADYLKKRYQKDIKLTDE